MRTTMDLKPSSKRFHISGRPGPADRPPLPSGHPITWSLITDGTVLERSAYPYPVFDCESEVAQ